MPFTPFHMGPGLAIKGLAGRHFSLLTFGVAQVAMDIEPLIGMIGGAERLHGLTHTYLAALGIAVLVAIVSPALCLPILRRWNRELRFYGLSHLAVPDALERFPAIAGAFVGTLSHVLLDSLMHAEMTPFFPWSDTNGLLGVISLSALHRGCMAAGLLGVTLWLATAWFHWRRAVRAQCPAPPCPAPWNPEDR